MPSSNLSRFISKPNETTKIEIATGDLETKEIPMKASTAILDGGLLMPEGGSTGYYTLATAASTSIPYLLMGTIASTDSDYATAGKLKKAYKIPASSGDKYELYFPVGNGTATAALIGNTVDLHDAYSADVDADSVHQIRVTDFISATLIKGTINI
jgi:hypothetical protein